MSVVVVDVVVVATVVVGVVVVVVVVDCCSVVVSLLLLRCDAHHASSLDFSAVIRRGFGKKSFMPMLRHRAWSPSRTLAVKATIGKARYRSSDRARIFCVASKPSITGIATSISTKS